MRWKFELIGNLVDAIGESQKMSKRGEMECRPYILGEHWKLSSTGNDLAV